MQKIYFVELQNVKTGTSDVMYSIGYSKDIAKVEEKVKQLNNTRVNTLYFYKVKSMGDYFDS